MVISFVPSAIAPELGLLEAGGRAAVAGAKRHNIFHEESGGDGGKGYASEEGGGREGGSEAVPILPAAASGDVSSSRAFSARSAEPF